MPFSQWLLLKIPTLFLGVLVVGSSVILAILGLLFVRRLIPHHRLKLHNDVAGPIFGTLGVVYAVLLAFVVIVVWQNFDKSDLNVEKEANCLADLYKDAEAFSQEFKYKARSLINEYIETVIYKEWPMLSRGEENLQAAGVTARLWKLYSSYLPQGPTEQIFLEESVAKLNTLSDLRMVRLMDARSGVHPVLWFVLIVGGINTIIFTFVFGTENLRAQIAMAVLLAILISLILFTILVLDFPFSGGISVTDNAFRQVLTNKY